MEAAPQPSAPLGTVSGRQNWGNRGLHSGENSCSAEPSLHDGKDQGRASTQKKTPLGAELPAAWYFFSYKAVSTSLLQADGLSVLADGHSEENTQISCLIDKLNRAIHHANQHAAGVR